MALDNYIYSTLYQFPRHITVPSSNDTVTTGLTSHSELGSSFQFHCTIVYTFNNIIPSSSSDNYIYVCTDIQPFKSSWLVLYLVSSLLPKAGHIILLAQKVRFEVIKVIFICHAYDDSHSSKLPPGKPYVTFTANHTTIKFQFSNNCLVTVECMYKSQLRNSFVIEVGCLEPVSIVILRRINSLNNLIKPGCLDWKMVNTFHVSFQPLKEAENTVCRTCATRSRSTQSSQLLSSTPVSIGNLNTVKQKTDISTLLIFLKLVLESE